MKVTGILSIRNGVGLEYPFPPVLLNLSQLCDDVVFGWDPAFIADLSIASSMNLPNIHLMASEWDMAHQGHGFEIARQMDHLVDVAKQLDSDWVVVLQADELFHNDDFSELRALMEEHLNTNVTGFSTERIYFWKNLDTLRTDWNAKLIRIFKPGTHSFLAEGTSKDGMYSAPIVPGETLELSHKIYHYSRVGEDTAAISKRVRNLDGFFHQEEDLISFEDLPDYDFAVREYDNFAKEGGPKEVEGSFASFVGTHPLGVKEWFEGV